MTEVSEFAGMMMRKAELICKLKVSEDLLELFRILIREEILDADQEGFFDHDHSEASQ